MYSKLRVFHSILIIFAVFDILISLFFGTDVPLERSQNMTHLDCIKAHIIELIDNSTDIDLLDLVFKLLLHED